MSRELQDFWTAHQPSLLYRCAARFRQTLRMLLMSHWCAPHMCCCLLLHALLDSNAKLLQPFKHLIVQEQGQG